MFENPRRGRQAINFTTNAPKILDLKSSSEQIFSRKLPLGAPDIAPSIRECDQHQTSSFNIYPLTMRTVMRIADTIAHDNLLSYLNSFSSLII